MKKTTPNHSLAVSVYRCRGPTAAENKRYLQQKKEGEALPLKPFTAEAMIHSLGEKRKALIVLQEDNNHCQAVYNQQLCTAVYNPFSGLHYVDDKYGVIKAWNEEEQYAGKRNQPSV